VCRICAAVHERWFGPIPMASIPWPKRLAAAGIYVYDNLVVVEFDPEKSARNLAERGLPFERVNEFDWSRLVVIEDDRKEYGELRLILIGNLDGKLHIAIVTPRDNDLRVISLRRANSKEVRLYGQEIGRGGRTP
jgi:uncharacterized DUF497 family protein